MPSVGFKPVDEHLLPTADWIKFLPRLEQRKYRMANLLSKGSPTPWETSSKSWSLSSLLSPISFEPSTGSNSDQLGGITFNKTLYDNDDKRFDQDARVRASEHTEFVQAGLAFRSIGYKSSALENLASDLGVPFNDRSGTIPNDMHGRILGSNGKEDNSEDVHLPGCYCAGWVKRGPTGVIASTMEDAFASADSIIGDWGAGVRFLNGSTQEQSSGTSLGWRGVVQETDVHSKKTLRPVSWQDWMRIDFVEREKGKAKGKVREKFTSIKEMLEVLD